MSRRKVVHLTSVHPASDGRIVYRECATLADAGYDVVIVAAGHSVSALPAGVRLHSVPLPRNRYERMTRTIWHVFRAALEEHADVYHFHDPELMGVGLALRATGAQVVFDVHEDIPHDIADKPWISPALRKPIALGSALVLRLLHQWYSAIVTATPAIARRFPHHRTVVVANYPRLDELAMDPAADFAGRDRAAIYIGSITQLRCVEEMVNAMESPELAPEVRLRLAGTFENEELEHRVRQLSGWSSVDYLGFRPRAEALRALNSARAGLLLFQPALNHEECLPTKLFEYLGVGLPVIISDSIAYSSVVREHECGIVVQPHDIDGIARAITLLIENPALAQAMGERGRRLVTERYEWTSEAKKLTKLYAEIA